MKRSLGRAIVTDAQFWIPVGVLLLGAGLLLALR
ncbi:MAG: translocated intimin receptor Tir [Acidobacteria bacterium]|nr:translocated intimin receptor Tir [Acidobacteriota bacterium]